jgi:predicted GH43/DUF377 family glycosyl hydrolase
MPLRATARAAASLAALGLAAACSNGGSAGASAPALDASRITPACFQGGTSPEIQIGDEFTGADWNDPHVLKVGSQYWMYASSNLGFPPAAPSPVQIYRFTSSDGATWTIDPVTPVLTVATAQWDKGGNETPAVVSFGGKYHMFWTGYPDAWPNFSPLHFKIGHATSTDGTAWTKDAAPLIGPGASGSFNEFITAEPGPVVFNNTLYLYFTAVGVDAGLAASLQTVGVIKSTDGVNWSAPALAFKPDQSVYPRGSNWVGYSTPNAAVIGGKVHVFVDVANDHGNDTWTQEALHHAYSADGLSGWTQDPAPLRRLTDFAWTKREIRSGAALLDGTTLRLYFAGDDIKVTGAWGIGQVTCSLAAP